MNLGNKIVSFRKKNNLSQEELAEKVGVTRQTISKWELEETTPDISQAKKLSQIFNVSLDELTNNDINSILVEKVSNTERLAGITMSLQKKIWIGIIIFISIIVGLIFLVLINISHKDRKIVGQISIKCNLDSEEYFYDIEYNKNYQIINAGGDAWIANHTDIEKYDDANTAAAHIDDYFKDHHGSCNINELKR